MDSNLGYQWVHNVENILGCFPHPFQRSFDPKTCTACHGIIPFWVPALVGRRLFWRRFYIQNLRIFWIPLPEAQWLVKFVAWIASGIYLNRTMESPVICMQKWSKTMIFHRYVNTPRANTTAILWFLSSSLTRKKHCQAWAFLDCPWQDCG